MATNRKDWEIQATVVNPADARDSVATKATIKQHKALDVRMAI
jgi:hypothetical protein